MKQREIQLIAKARGVAPGRRSKVNLVRAMQQEEGNTTCFQTGQANSCRQEDCLWRDDCA